jgi:hypothetical protein
MFGVFGSVGALAIVLAGRAIAPLSGLICLSWLVTGADDDGDARGDVTTLGLFLLGDSTCRFVEREFTKNGLILFVNGRSRPRRRRSAGTAECSKKNAKIRQPFERKENRMWPKRH